MGPKMELTSKIKKELKRHLTIMFIPHNTVKPIKISFTFSFLLFLMFSWSGLTIWAGFLASRHIDYWKTKADNELMNIKVKFFAKEIKKSQEMLEIVKQKDLEVRSLLNMKSRQVIIEKEGRGGPTPEEAKDLERVLEGKVHEMTAQDISRQTMQLKEDTKKQLDSFDEIFNYVDDQRTLFRATPNMWPCVGHFTSTFGFRIHPVYERYEFHSGLDIANLKNTPIYATADGKIILADWESGYGRLIIVDNGYGYKTLYGHLEKILVKQDERVQRGQLIGLMGETGTTTGTHVHYEIRFHDKAVNPMPFLKNTIENVTTAKQQ
jgi:murein DD-endopeptidase MepM/ murein hydrolase activator NlpD